MNCPVCGLDLFSFCIAGKDRVYRCHLAEDTFITIDLLTCVELTDEGEKPPILSLSCCNCRATLFKSPETPLPEAWARHCRTACSPLKREPHP